MLVMKVSVLPGDTIKHATNEMLRLQRLLDVVVTGKFNGVELHVYAGSDEASIASEYKRGLEEQERKLGLHE